MKVLKYLDHTDLYNKVTQLYSLSATLRFSIKLRKKELLTFAVSKKRSLTNQKGYAII